MHKCVIDVLIKCSTENVNIKIKAQHCIFKECCILLMHYYEHKNVSVFRSVKKLMSSSDNVKHLFLCISQCKFIALAKPII